MQIYKTYLGYNNAVYTVGNPAVNTPLMGIKILTFYWICLKEVIIYMMAILKTVLCSAVEVRHVLNILLIPHIKVILTDYHFKQIFYCYIKLLRNIVRTNGADEKDIAANF